MTPSKEAMDAATWIVDKYLDYGYRYKLDDYREDHAEIAGAIDRYFADVILKAAAMDALAAMCAPNETVRIGKADDTDWRCQHDEADYRAKKCPSLSAAIVSLAAKIGAKP